MEEKIVKCPSCGASLKEDEKYCSYCGTKNPAYKEKVVPEVTTPSEENDSSGAGLGGALGGFMGGILLGGALRGARRPPHPPMRGGHPPRRR